MKRVALGVGLIFAFSLWCVAAPQSEQKATEQKPPESSPHGEAISLVLSTKQKEIRALDEGEWWHDVKTREWKVRRPFYPGVFDSTHWFIVTYQIDGLPAQSWLVDTRKKTVEVHVETTAEDD